MNYTVCRIYITDGVEIDIYSPSEISLTEINKDVDIIDVIKKTKYKESGMGGITTGGTMYVGYPRV